MPYIDSTEWIIKKKAMINPKSTDEKCFQYAATVALNYGEIKWYLGRVSIIKPLINICNWKEINYPTKYMIGKFLRSIIQQLLLILCILKKKKYF